MCLRTFQGLSHILAQLNFMKALCHWILTQIRLRVFGIRTFLPNQKPCCRELSTKSERVLATMEVSTIDALICLYFHDFLILAAILLQAAVTRLLPSCLKPPFTIQIHFAHTLPFLLPFPLQLQITLFRSQFDHDTLIRGYSTDCHSCCCDRPTCFNHG